MNRCIDEPTKLAFVRHKWPFSLLIAGARTEEHVRDLARGLIYNDDVDHRQACDNGDDGEHNGKHPRSTAWPFCDVVVPPTSSSAPSSSSSVPSTTCTTIRLTQEEFDSIDQEGSGSSSLSRR